MPGKPAPDQAAKIRTPLAEKGKTRVTRDERSTVMFHSITKTKPGRAHHARATQASPQEGGLMAMGWFISVMVVTMRTSP